eukprot:symbB.v1.2.011877.t1/scaffold806.1/size231046/4
MLNALLAVWYIDQNEEVFCEALCEVVGCGNHSGICSCEIGCGESCCADFAEVCHNGKQMYAPMSCADVEKALSYNTQQVAILLVLLSPLAIGLSVYAYHHGRKLYERLSAGDMLLIEREGQEQARLNPDA